MRKKFTKKQIEEMKRLYESGMSLYQIGKKFKKNHSTIKYNLKKRGVELRDGLKPKNCVVCGKKFKPKRERQKYCHDPCNCEYHGPGKFNTLRYFYIKTIRSEFARRIKDNPGKALQIVSDMIEEEGQEFKDMVLDGITETPEFEDIVKTYIKYKKVFDNKE